MNAANGERCQKGLLTPWWAGRLCLAKSQNPKTGVNLYGIPIP